ncbi:MAG: hypothetical protein WDW36_007126 [Sanguina aurantia]
MTCRQLHDEEAWLLLDTIIGPVAGEGLEQALDTTRFGKKAVRRLGSGTTTTSPEEAEEGKHAFLPCSTMPRFKARMEEAGEAAYVQMESSFRETGGWPSVSQVAVRIQLLLHDMPQDGAKPLDRTHMLKLQATYPSLRHDPRGAGKPGRSSKPGSRYVRPEHAEILTELDERMSQAAQTLSHTLLPISEALPTSEANQTSPQAQLASTQLAASSAAQDPPTPQQVSLPSSQHPSHPARPPTPTTRSEGILSASAVTDSESGPAPTAPQVYFPAAAPQPSPDSAAAPPQRVPTTHSQAIPTIPTIPPPLAFPGSPFTPGNTGPLPPAAAVAYSAGSADTGFTDAQAPLPNPPPPSSHTSPSPHGLPTASAGVPPAATPPPPSSSQEGALRLPAPGLPRHKLPGMINTKTKRCEEPGCFKTPTFAVGGARTPRFCAAHKEAGMVNIFGVYCAHEGCSTHATFAHSRWARVWGLHVTDHRTIATVEPAGGPDRPCLQRRLATPTVTGRLCADHSRMEMRVTSTSGLVGVEGVNSHRTSNLPTSPPHAHLLPVATDTRVHQAKGGAGEDAGAGSPSDRRRRYCAAHRGVGMVDVAGRLCQHPGCALHPTFAAEHETLARFCVGHKGEGMVDVKHRRCSAPGCVSRPTFGLVGGLKTERCMAHRTEGMVTVTRITARARGEAARCAAGDEPQPPTSEVPPVRGPQQLLLARRERGRPRMDQPIARLPQSLTTADLGPGAVQEAAAAAAQLATGPMPTTTAATAAVSFSTSEEHVHVAPAHDSSTLPGSGSSSVIPPHTQTDAPHAHTQPAQRAPVAAQEASSGLSAAEPPLALHVPDGVDIATMSVTGEEALAPSGTVQLDPAEPQAASKLGLTRLTLPSVPRAESLATAAPVVELTSLPPQLAAGLAELRAELKRVERYMARMGPELAEDAAGDEAAPRGVAAPGTALLDRAAPNVSNGAANASQDGAASEEQAAAGDASLDSAVLDTAVTQEQPVLGTAAPDRAVHNAPEREESRDGATLHIAATGNMPTTEIAALGDVILDTHAGAPTFDILAFLKALPHLAPTLTSITTGTTTITVTTGTTYTFSPPSTNNNSA